MSADLVTREPALPDRHAEIDRLEIGMLRAFGEGTLRPVEMPVVHRFTPGLYARHIFMPAGTLLTSKIHLTEHPYVVLRGRVSVFIPGVGVEHIEAPHVGITKPRTRRVLYIHEDCEWVTFHPLVAGEESESDLGAIESRIIERRELPDGGGATVNDHYRALLDELRESGVLEPGEFEEVESLGPLPLSEDDDEAEEPRP